MLGKGTHQASGEEQRRKSRMVKLIVFFILGLSVIVSYGWDTSPPAFRPDAPNIILFGILVAAIVFIASGAAMQAPGEGWPWFRLRVCPSCGRQIPFDSIVCPYCRRELP